MCPNATAAVAERKPNACSRSFRCVPTPLKCSHDAVSDFDHAILIWRPLESDTSDDRAAVSIDDGEAMNPRIRDRRCAEACEPVWGDLIRHEECTESIERWQPEALLEVLISLDQCKQMPGSVGYQLEMNSLDRHAVHIDARPNFAAAQYAPEKSRGPRQPRFNNCAAMNRLNVLCPTTSTVPCSSANAHRRSVARLARCRVASTVSDERHQCSHHATRATTTQARGGIRKDTPIESGRTTSRKSGSMRTCPADASHLADSMDRRRSLATTHRAEDARRCTG
jgi:hypothetical protein